MAGGRRAVLGVGVGRGLGHWGSLSFVGPDAEVALVALCSGHTDSYCWGDRSDLVFGTREPGGTLMGGRRAEALGLPCIPPNRPTACRRHSHHPRSGQGPQGCPREAILLWNECQSPCPTGPLFPRGSAHPGPSPADAAAHPWRPWPMGPLWAWAPSGRGPPRLEPPF